MSADVRAILSTPVYGEPLGVLHVAGPAELVTARAVAGVQTAAGWRTGVLAPDALPEAVLDDVDVVVLWGRRAAAGRDVVAGRRATVVVLDARDVRAVLTSPLRWARELRRTARTNLLLVPAGLAERYTRWGPPVPLAHRPEGLPEQAAVTVLSAWTARAHAFGARPAG
ncbi:hypothetical protein [Modestobacter sp. VKM Ac-2984]|uniref:hypothetical protein n=1 Tax=Modestobacter sp. VKM Ac-2984 TaxID=3004138 RepID=UPI0022AAF58D|nr:hypothetical protein [Modestobacter sp. VKM Ac-2984]MCZ2817375.1 hypothetical protein [Modestobacter sp. VKM Ac-2984]